ncbi:arsenate reductase (glutaredoxin) [Roseomonas sp. 18066]|uniref:arsenate reductase (glutaredoxin) n=1 Tax=Roseomonas sp. 18066 TaxID=2681412 RepID=UPI00135C5A4C|nr:arsenate reductase (glutaredoxin) [Roseomonas sp. 18066]
MTVTIFHNPRCGTSRGTLALLREAGIEPAIVEYLKTPLDAAALQGLVARLGIPARDLLRAKEPAFAARGLGDPALTDEAAIAAMVAEPILMNRPVVVTEQGARLCRPPERVKEILPG